jgi:hypothetical protein
MIPYTFEETIVGIFSSLLGIIAAYGVGLAIALVKDYRDPYYFFAWPASIKVPIGVIVAYLAIRAAWNSMMLCAGLGGLVRLCGLLA